MIVSRCRPFESMRVSWRTTCGGSGPEHALEQHARVAEDRVERRPELVRHVREELRLRARGRLELERLPLEQLVLANELGGRVAHLLLEEARGLLQLLVERVLLHRLGAVVEDRDDRGDLAVLREDLAADRLDGHGRGRLRIEQTELAAEAPAGLEEEEVGDVRREVRVVRADAQRSPRSARPRLAVKRRSAGAFVMIMPPFASVTMIGSATESMMRSSRSRSARTSASATRSLR